MSRPKIRGPLPDLSGIDPIDWARLAAFIDGEGCILLNRHQGKRRRNMWLRVHVVNTDPRLPRWILDTFKAGSVTVHFKGNKAKNWRSSLIWQSNCQSAEMILRGCLPYFIIKREQAEIALAFQATLGGPGSAISEETHDRREQLREELHLQKRDVRLEKFETAPYVAAQKRGPKPHSTDSVN